MNARYIVPVVIAGLAFASVAVAGGGHGGPLHHIAHAFKEIGLTDAQKAQMQGLREARKAQEADEDAARDALFGQLTAELAKDKPNKKALHDLIDQEARRSAEDHKARLDELLTVHATLTPDQRQALANALTVARDEREGAKDRLKEAWNERKGELRREFKRDAAVPHE